MPKSVADLIAEAKREVSMISVDEAARRLRDDPSLVVLDVREPGEHAKAALPTSANVPRGLLEIKISGYCASADQPILLHCAGGGRAALAAKTLGEMGYTQVCAVDGKFTDLHGIVTGSGE